MYSNRSGIFEKYSKDQIRGYLMMKMKDKYFLNILYQELQEKGEYLEENIKNLTNQEITDFIYKNNNLEKLVNLAELSKDKEKQEKEGGFNKKVKDELAGLHLAIKVVELKEFNLAENFKGGKELMVIVCFLEMRERTIPCGFSKDTTNIMQVSF